MAGQSRKILVVDDEPHILLLVRKILEKEGFTVETAEDGEKGIAKVKSFRPDLVVLDMMMPGLSGREVCERLRHDQKTKAVKVVFLTVARFSEVGKNILKEQDVMDYITKPFDNDDLVRRVRKALGQ